MDFELITIVWVKCPKRYSENTHDDYVSYLTKHFQPFLDMNDNVKVVTTQRLEDKEKGLQGAELEVASLNR